MNFIELDEVDSTNTFLSLNHNNFPHLTMLNARTQRAGRGQRGNHWESEPGSNLTFSVLIKPDNFLAKHQFVISEATALAIIDFLSLLGVEARVKWPNDIYVGDRKICGILIEHSVMGMNITHSIIGVGININQEKFLSDAPNPVSLFQLLNRKSDIVELRFLLADQLEKRLSVLNDAICSQLMHKEFTNNMWRGDGRFYRFEDSASGHIFEARIADVEETGYLHLEERNSKCRRYAFKEVKFILSQPETQEAE